MKYFLLALCLLPCALFAGGPKFSFSVNMMQPGPVCPPPAYYAPPAPIYAPPAYYAPPVYAPAPPAPCYYYNCPAPYPYYYYPY